LCFGFPLPDIRKNPPLVSAKLLITGWQQVNEDFAILTGLLVLVCCSVVDVTARSAVPVSAAANLWQLVVDIVDAVDGLGRTPRGRAELFIDSAGPSPRLAGAWAAGQGKTPAPERIHRLRAEPSLCIPELVAGLPRQTPTMLLWCHAGGVSVGETDGSSVGGEGKIRMSSGVLIWLPRGRFTF
jgi:hypothetical protein